MEPTLAPPTSSVRQFAAVVAGTADRSVFSVRYPLTPSPAAMLLSVWPVLLGVAARAGGPWTMSGNLPEHAVSPTVPTIDDLIALNKGAVEDEPEDQALAASGVLARLIAEAHEVPPSRDWERDLYEL